MKLIITIDTEEDAWASYSPSANTLENIQRIPSLQQLFDDFKVKPTYLITFPVATDEKSISILESILKGGKCEIGTHCHPWNTPPFEEEKTPKNSMLCNLPADLQYKKIKFLHDTIERNFDIKPVSFRSGRWGYNQDVARSIHRLGYKVDTSVTAYTDWTDYNGPDFSDIPPHPFRFSYNNIFQGSTNGHLIEIPATVGFLQQDFAASNYIFNLVKKNPLNRLKIIGLLDRLNLINKIWLSPEASHAPDMIKLAQKMMQNHYQFINMFFHSSSLKSGLTPFVKTVDDEKRFFHCLREFFSFTQDAGIESILLRDIVDLI